MNAEQYHFGGAMKSVSPSPFRETKVQIPDVKWQYIGGRESSEMVHTSSTPEIYAEYGPSTSRDCLRRDPPGCGKPMNAKVITSECAANFIRIKAPSRRPTCATSSTRRAICRSASSYSTSWTQ